ncbi:hypothetical protein [Pseudoalteromonas sp. MMG012]|uniref:hypothetical protein n=1 Tax=Pseudoalteromonas sp. MMG012 TaxID=2822686 RepID=UPI001B3A7954|nr:hypothetical protein [Pseudoalteromonas sp. MMG012]MBQ4852952.1 hypothetical protein [Pseudoalteromonas sp. MMG012]
MEMIVIACLGLLIVVSIVLSLCAFHYKRPNLVVVPNVQLSAEDRTEFFVYRERKELDEAAKLLALSQILEDIFEGISEEELLALELQFKLERKKTLLALKSMGVINQEVIMRSITNPKKQA